MSDPIPTPLLTSIVPDSAHLSDSSDFDSCCASDDEAPPSLSPATHCSSPLNPLPFILELPPRAKKCPVPSDEKPPAKRVSYAARSCSSEEIPSFETIADRTVGTVGFVAGLMIYVGLCCCAYNSQAGDEIVETYEHHTLFSYLWSIK
jgi:hypothetical protein